MENELFDIPSRARICYEKNKGLILPDKVPYVGMGSSYFAAVTLRYLGVKIFPEIAAEYFNYIKHIKQFETGVIISQSGRTSDVLDCVSCFNEFIAIVNDAKSPLANKANVRSVIRLHAGPEWFSSTKTFINTLVTLYLGHGFDVKNVLDIVERRFPELEALGHSMGESLFNNVRKQKSMCFILGSGPNIGIAYQAALMLNESIKYPFVGMSLAQYEHGFKESATDSFIVVINPAKGAMHQRASHLIETLRKAGARVIELCDVETDELYSPFTSVLPFYFMADYLSSRLGIVAPFLLGSKITER